MCSSARLSIALLIFAGRDPLDIALVHDVRKTEIHHRTWRVVDAINLDKIININFPVIYEEQRHIANGFKVISAAEFDNCAGCIDGSLAWTLRPHEKTMLCLKWVLKKNNAGEREILVWTFKVHSIQKENSWTQALGILVLLLII